MKFLDIVTDWFSETPLFEMAYQRKHVISKIRDLQDEIATHLVKHLCYDVPVETKKHWEAEINAWLLKIHKLKLKNGKKLSGDMYYELLFKEPLGERTDVQGIIDAIDVIDGMDAYDKVMPVPELHERLEQILHTLSYDISNTNIKHIKEYL